MEFTNYVESIVLSSEPLSTGDCNIHIDNDDHYAVKLLDLLQSTAIEQYVSMPTH